MTFLLRGESLSLDPFVSGYSSASDGSRLAAIYDTLVWTNPATGAVEGQLLESLIPTDNSGSTWRLRLRPNIRFSDGEPFNAEAIRLNWERHGQEQVHSPQRAAAAGLKITVLDDLELSVRLPAPNANFDRTVARHLSFIAAPNAIASGTLGEKPVGAGPFVLGPGDWVKNRSMTLKRNPAYWQTGRPYLDQVVFKAEPRTEAAVSSIADSDADVTVTVDPLGVRLAKDKGLSVEALHLSGGEMLSFNTAVGPFADPDARRAVALSLSGAAINDIAFHGAGTPARGIFSDDSPLANNQLAAEENDPVRSAQLWAKVTRNGTKPFTATLIAPEQPSSRALGQYVAAELAKYPAVSVRVDVVDLMTFIQLTVIKHTFDVRLGQLWADDPEPSVHDYLYGSSPANCCLYNNPDVNAALDLARAGTDTATRRNAYTEVQVALNKDMPVWVYQEAVAGAIHGPRVTNVQLFNDGIVLMDRVGLRR
ncbi:ABC transporter substrate-binding protein [Yinghuangia seranimata]|uniref:ABC transporter substrate-binding protein n=1 Tax=Yinghuangia seranimata TaxID=408067 RepID=UPI00248B1C48|nr:ABC transporter substrate-binding protein [Yinghuangia seranimata]MDI2124975.1 ABC transporter substrate-binding protein [Yinghuangia seranimata]